MVKPVLWMLVGTSAALFALASGLAQEYSAAALCIAAGALWLLLEIRRSDITRVVFLLFFIGVAVVDSLKNAPMPLILLALSSGLAAWDLSSFRRRIANVEDGEAKAALERRHLQKLGLTAGAGFLAALIPLLAQISLPFVALSLLLLAAIVALSRTVSSLLGKREEP